MKKQIFAITTIILLLAITGCQREADKVSYNLSLEADNFNVVRQLTAINNITGDVMFQMTGKMTIKADTADNQLEIVVEDENGKYKKHFIGLNQVTSYVVEDITGADVNKYKYTLNYNPKMWIPVQIEPID